MSALRGAILGFGGVATEAHLPGFAAAPELEIVSVVDASEERREAAARALPGAAVFESLDALLAAGPGIDFVDVATPSGLHAADAATVLEAGLHVLCEKPLVSRREELESLLGLAAARRRVLHTVHNWKFASFVPRLAGWLRAGAVGEPLTIDWWVSRPHPPRGASPGQRSWRTMPELAGGGIVLDHGWHAFYLLLAVTGTEPCRLSADVRREQGLPVEDNAEIRIELPRAEARVHLSWTAERRETRGVFAGPLGSIEVGDDRIALRATGREPEEERFSPAISASSYHPEWFPPVLAEFREEVLGAGSGGANLREAAQCARMVFATYASNGQAVVLDGTGTR